MTLLVFLTVWVGTGVVVAVAMARHGHSAFSWGLLGALLGPLTVPLALDARAHPSQRAVVTSSGTDRFSGPVAVLAGIDGSPESVSALQAALELLGGRAGRVRLVAVVSQDAATNSLMFDELHADARRWLERAAEVTTGAFGEQVVVAGDPVEVLTGNLAEGFDVIVIGPRGSGFSKRLFGSVARELPGRSRVPVLIGGRAVGLADAGRDRAA